MDAPPANLQTHMSPLQENVNGAAQPHVSARRARPLRLSAARGLGDLRLSSESTLMPRLTFDVISVLNVAPSLHSFQTSLLTHLRAYRHLAANPTFFYHTRVGWTGTIHTPPGAHRQCTMARAKSQQRQANGASHQLDVAVHSLEKKMEEQAALHARNPQEQNEAGLGQLVVCVGGIYASL
jgi:hypothetical protein